MKNRKLGFILFIICVVLFLLIIGGGVYLYKNKKEETINHSVNINLDNKISDTNSPNMQDDQSQAFENNFKLENNATYSISLSVKNCNDDKCSGPGKIYVIDNESKNLIQIIDSTDLSFFKDTLSKTSTEDTVLYDEQSPIIIGDYNFDELLDLAIRNGSNGSYGSPSYNIYIFDKTSKQFILNNSLTDLVSQNLGMFFVDKEKKLLTTYSKSGCCWHETNKYQVINNQPLLVYTLTEDAAGINKVKEGNMLVTEKKLVDGEWVITNKEVSKDEYYGN